MKQKMKPIENMWRTYAALAVPRDASKIQCEQTRLAFFAGASSLFLAMIMMQDGDTDDATDQELSFMDDVYDEVKKYGEKLDSLVGIQVH